MFLEGCCQRWFVVNEASRSCLLFLSIQDMFRLEIGRIYCKYDASVALVSGGLRVHLNQVQGAPTTVGLGLWPGAKTAGRAPLSEAATAALRAARSSWPGLAETYHSQRCFLQDVSMKWKPGPSTTAHVKRSCQQPP